MTCKMRLKEGSVRIGVPQHIYVFGLNLRSEDRGGVYILGKVSLLGVGGAGAQLYIFVKVSLLGVQKFQHQSHMSYKSKAFVVEA